MAIYARDHLREPTFDRAADAGSQQRVDDERITGEFGGDVWLAGAIDQKLATGFLPAVEIGGGVAFYFARVTDEIRLDFRAHFLQMARGDEIRRRHCCLCRRERRWGGA